MDKKAVHKKDESHDDHMKAAAPRITTAAHEGINQVPPIDGIVRPTLDEGDPPPDSAYTLIYFQNPESNKLERIMPSFESMFAWKGRTGSIDSPDGNSAMQYNSIRPATAADGKLVNFYVFDEVDPLNDNSAGWAFEVTPRKYPRDPALLLCTVGFYASAAAKMELKGLATKDK